MRLNEDNMALASPCRSVERRLQDVSRLADLVLPVCLLSNFDHQAEVALRPFIKMDPAAYRSSLGKILVNEMEFFKLPSPTADLVLVHEIAHAYCCLVDPSFSERQEFSGVAKSRLPEMLADLLVCQWGMEVELVQERQASCGSEYCQALQHWRNLGVYVNMMEVHLDNKLIKMAPTGCSREIPE